MVKALNDYLDDIREGRESVGEEGFVKYNLAVKKVNKLYDECMDTLVMATIGNNAEKLMEHGITVDSKEEFDALLNEKNDVIIAIIRDVVTMHFGYEEVINVMNKDRIFDDDETAMKKEDISYKQYPTALVDYDEHKGIHAGDSAKKAMMTGDVGTVVYAPMYHRSATMEFRILEGGVIKMTELDTEDGISILIVPVQGYEAVDVMLIDKNFTEYNLSEEDFEGLSVENAMERAWSTLYDGVNGDTKLDKLWNNYLKETGQVEEDEDELDDFDRKVLNSINDSEEVENRPRYFVKKESKKEQNTELAKKLDDAFKKYKEMNEYERNKILEEKSIKMPRVIQKVYKRENNMQ